jgi:hypothetical protein
MKATSRETAVWFNTVAGKHWRIRLDGNMAAVLLPGRTVRGQSVITVRAGKPGFFNSMSTGGRPLTKPTGGSVKCEFRSSVSSTLEIRHSTFHRR